jgi:outer membrane receptor protein involved in Fe transport
MIEKHALRKKVVTGAMAVAIALSATARVARADGLADEAELHFQRGANHYTHGEFDLALEHFLFSNRLVPNRNVIFNIARTFVQLKQFANAHRYFVDALSVETNPQKINEIKESIARIAPNVAVLAVTTSPPGATIYINRKDLGSRGVSPRPLAVPPGRYQVIAELEGYEPVTSTVVEAQTGKELSLSLTLNRIVGTVHAEVTGASDAEVRVDDEHGAPACTAPCDLRLPPGRHEIYFTREGYQAAPQMVSVVAYQKLVARGVLSPLTGSVVVLSDEPGAMVTINGHEVGVTPLTVPNVLAGRQKVRVTLRGFVPIEREIVVVPNQQVQLSGLTLAPVREVTGVSRYAEQIDDAPSSVSIIDGQELRAFGYPTIAESIRGIRGVYLANDRVYYSAGIRGLGQPNDYGARVLVLSDGQSLNENLLNSSYIGSDGRADLGDIDRIEVVRGPGSLLYGTGAFSGVINLVTRPRDEPSGAHVAVGTYDNGVAHARAGFHYNFTPNAGVWASVSGARSDGIDVGVPLLTLKKGQPLPTARGADAFDSVGTAGRAWWGPLTVQWFYHQRSQNTPIGSYATTFDDSRSSSADTRMMTEVRYEPKLSNSFQLMTRVHANRYLFDGYYSYQPEYHLENFVGTWFGAEARLVYSPSSRLRITGGFEGQIHPEATFVGQAVAPDGDKRKYLDEHDPYKFAAAYAIAEGSPVPWFRASGGVRVDIYSTFGPIFVPRAALIFKPVTGGTLKVMGGRAFRAPSIYEQNYNDGGESELKARPLRPETVDSGELEYTQRFAEDWVALGAAHASYLRNLISTYPVTPTSELVSYQNVNTPALAVGGDVELRREWRKGWMFAAMYGYQYCRFLDPPHANPRLVAAPEHLASLRMVAPVVRELASIGLRATLEGPRRIDTETDRTTSPAVIADVTVSGGIRQFGLRYTFGVYNLIGWRYEYPVTENFLSHTMPQNGRTFLFNLQFTYPPPQ